MSAVSLNEASELLRTVAGSRLAGESMKAVLHRLARKLPRWSASRIKDIWYRDPRTSVRAAELEQLRELAERSDRRKNDHELTQLREKVDRLERLLVHANTSMAGANGSEAGAGERRARRADRAMARSGFVSRSVSS